MGKNTKKRDVLCAQYNISGVLFSIPVLCPLCNEKGLLLSYDHKIGCMRAFCGPREDVRKRYIKGCNKGVFIAGMTELEYRKICVCPETSDHFFMMVTL